MVENKTILTKILTNHYEWCKENGRNTSWYKKIKRQMSKIPKKTRNSS